MLGGRDRRNPEGPRLAGDPEPGHAPRPRRAAARRRPRTGPRPATPKGRSSPTTSGRNLVRDPEVGARARGAQHGLRDGLVAGGLRVVDVADGADAVELPHPRVLVLGVGVLARLMADEEVIRPAVPLPVMPETSIPSASALRRAIGEMRGLVVGVAVAGVSALSSVAAATAASLSCAASTCPETRSAERASSTFLPGSATSASSSRPKAAPTARRSPGTAPEP